MIQHQERYNEYFATVEEARLHWAMFHWVRYGLNQPVPPLPGEMPRPPVRPRDNSLFGTLRQVDLSQYAGRFTQLRPVGPGKWRGYCPLHEEQTPSFYVYADPWRWRCYGACAQGGDIVALARELRRRERRR